MIFFLKIMKFKQNILMLHVCFCHKLPNRKWISILCVLYVRQTRSRRKRWPLNLLTCLYGLGPVTYQVCTLWYQFLCYHKFVSCNVWMLLQYIFFKHFRKTSNGQIFSILIFSPENPLKIIIKTCLLHVCIFMIRKLRFIKNASYSCTIATLHYNLNLP